MSKNVYIVEKEYHDFQMEDLINGPFTDVEVVKVLPSRKEAEDWVNNMFTKFLNEDQNFVDLHIIEKDLEEYISSKDNEPINDVLYIDAWVSQDLKVHISGFTKNPYEHEPYYDHADKRYHIHSRVPRMINSRKSLIDFLMKKVKEVKNK